MAVNVVSKKVKGVFTIPIQVQDVSGEKIIKAFKKTAGRRPTDDLITIVDGARCQWLWMMLRELGNEGAAYLTPRADFQQAPINPTGLYSSVYLVFTNTEGFIPSSSNQTFMEKLKTNLEKAIQE